MADEIDPWGPPGGNEGRDIASEPKKDLDMRYAYFLANNDGLDREIIVNKTVIPRGGIAGPLPAFAYIEEDGHIGFWHAVNGSTWGYEGLKHCRHEDDDGDDGRPDRDHNSPGRWYKNDLPKNKPVREWLDRKMMPPLPFELAIRPKRHGITAETVADMPDLEVHASGTGSEQMFRLPRSSLARRGNMRLAKRASIYRRRRLPEVEDIPEDAFDMATPLNALKRIGKKARKKADADKKPPTPPPSAKKSNGSKDIPIPSTEKTDADAEPKDDPLTRVRTTKSHSPEGNEKDLATQKRPRKAQSNQNLGDRTTKAAPETTPRPRANTLKDAFATPLGIRVGIHPWGVRGLPPHAKFLL